jgi:hypothetical protein
VGDDPLIVRLLLVGGEMHADIDDAEEEGVIDGDSCFDVSFKYAWQTFINISFHSSIVTRSCNDAR